MLVKKQVSYMSKKDNKEHKSYNFYEQIDVNGQNILIAVKPSFKNDYSFLCKVAKDLVEVK